MFGDPDICDLLVVSQYGRYRVSSQIAMYASERLKTMLKSTSPRPTALSLHDQPDLFAAPSTAFDVFFHWAQERELVMPQRLTTANAIELLELGEVLQAAKFSAALVAHLTAEGPLLPTESSVWAAVEQAFRLHRFSAAIAEKVFKDGIQHRDLKSKPPPSLYDRVDVGKILDHYVRLSRVTKRLLDRAVERPSPSASGAPSDSSDTCLSIAASPTDLASVRFLLASLDSMRPTRLLESIVLRRRPRYESCHRCMGAVYIRCLGHNQCHCSSLLVFV